MTTLNDLLEPPVAQVATNYYQGINQTYPGNAEVVQHNVQDYPNGVPWQPLTKKVGPNPSIRVHPAWLANARSPGWVGDPNVPHETYADIRDGLLFESFNVTVVVAVAQLQRDFQDTEDSLAVLGRSHSDLEAGTLFHSSQIYMALQQAGIAPCAASLRQLQRALQFAPNNTLPEYRVFMRASPQNPGAQDHTQMETAQVYQFAWVAGSGGGILAKKIKAWVLAAFRDHPSNKYKQLNEITRNGTPYQEVRQYIDTETSKGVLSPKATVETAKREKVAAYNVLIQSLTTKNPICDPVSTGAEFRCPTY